VKARVIGTVRKQYYVRSFYESVLREVVSAFIRSYVSGDVGAAIRLIESLYAVIPPQLDDTKISLNGTKVTAKEIFKEFTKHVDKYITADQLERMRQEHKVLRKALDTLRKIIGIMYEVQLISRHEEYPVEVITDEDIEPEVSEWGSE